ncbi:hypothetical protein HK104_003524 [Borealophlyctis nickersoniae]|nr:hypothetical protein HK104_003524 [Borealophlyctis nickersoniae]
MYIASGAVVVMEILKLAICVIALQISERSSSPSHLYATLQKNVLHNRETLKMIIPSAIYAVQNNLLYTALSNLDAATYQVTYQIKILTTALFSVLLLRRQLSKLKWAALLLLLVGVAMVQLQSPGDGKGGAGSIVAAGVTSNGVVSRNLTDTAAGGGAGAHPALERGLGHRRKGGGQNRWIGLAAVIISAISSGFAGCYFEAMLKSSDTNMWIRNIQLGLFGTAFSVLPVLSADLQKVIKDGFFSGYTPLTWVVIFNQAIGGLLVSLVVKYADNILKGFATSLSIVLSSVISAIWMNFIPSGGFVVGSGIVLVAVYLYSW